MFLICLPSLSHPSHLHCSFPRHVHYTTPNYAHYAHYAPLRYGTDAKIALVQRALALESGLQLYFSPWSPPAWMKTTNKIKGGELKGENRARQRRDTHSQREE